MNFKLRSISTFLVLLFSFEQLSFAADLKPQKFDLFPKENYISWAKQNLPDIPDSIATIEDAWKADSGSRMMDSGKRRMETGTIHDPQSNILVYLIADAHTNTSGQLNLSKTLDLILRSQSHNEKTSQSHKDTRSQDSRQETKTIDDGRWTIKEQNNHPASFTSNVSSIVYSPLSPKTQTIGDRRWTIKEQNLLADSGQGTGDRKETDRAMSPASNPFPIFIEAGSGNDSLSFLRQYSTLKQRQQAAMKYLKQGLLHGEEYLDLTSDHDFILWGVEDMALYQKALKSYKYVAKNRSKYQDYLKRIQQTIDTLKPKIYNPILLSFEEKQSQYLSTETGSTSSAKQEISLTDYFDILVQQAKMNQINLNSYPHLKALKILKQKEQAIDFKLANQEQQKAIQSLPEADQKELLELQDKDKSPFKLTSQDHKELKGFYALLEEKLLQTDSEKNTRAGDAEGESSILFKENHLNKIESRRRQDPRRTIIDTYPNLTKYFSYLKESKNLNPKAILDEQKSLETEILSFLAKTPDEQTLLQCQQTLRLLFKLFNLTLTPEEYQEYRTLTQGHNVTRTQRHKDTTSQSQNVTTSQDSTPAAGSLPAGQAGTRGKTISESSAQSDSFTLTHLTGFLNKKILDYQSYYERALFLEPGYEEITTKSEEFYQLTLERDKAFIENMLRKLNETASQGRNDTRSQDNRQETKTIDDRQWTIKEQNNHPSSFTSNLSSIVYSPSSPKKAVLITGGFHTPNLKHLLKQHNISYISLTPQVTHETNQKRYEELLLNQKLDTFSAISVSAHPSNPSMARLAGLGESQPRLESFLRSNNLVVPKAVTDFFDAKHGRNTTEYVFAGGARMALDLTKVKNLEQAKTFLEDANKIRDKLIELAQKLGEQTQLEIPNIRIIFSNNKFIEGKGAKTLLMEMKNPSQVDVVRTKADPASPTMPLYEFEVLAAFDEAFLEKHGLNVWYQRLVGARLAGNADLGSPDRGSREASREPLLQSSIHDPSSTIQNPLREAETQGSRAAGEKRSVYLKMRTSEILADKDHWDKLSRAQIYVLQQYLEIKTENLNRNNEAEKVINFYDNNEKPTFTASEHEDLLRRAKENRQLFSSDMNTTLNGVNGFDFSKNTFPSPGLQERTLSIIQKNLARAIQGSRMAEKLEIVPGELITQGGLLDSLRADVGTKRDKEHNILGFLLYTANNPQNKEVVPVGSATNLTNLADTLKMKFDAFFEQNPNAKIASYLLSFGDEVISVYVPEQIAKNVITQLTQAVKSRGNKKWSVALGFPAGSRLTEIDGVQYQIERDNNRTRIHWGLGSDSAEQFSLVVDETAESFILRYLQVLYDRKPAFKTHKNRPTQNMMVPLRTLILHYAMLSWTQKKKIQFEITQPGLLELIYDIYRPSEALLTTQDFFDSAYPDGKVFSLDRDNIIKFNSILSKDNSSETAHIVINSPTLRLDKIKHLAAHDFMDYLLFGDVKNEINPRIRALYNLKDTTTASGINTINNQTMVLERGNYGFKLWLSEDNRTKERFITLTISLKSGAWDADQVRFLSGSLFSIGNNDRVSPKMSQDYRSLNVDFPLDGSYFKNPSNASEFNLSIFVPAGSRLTQVRSSSRHGYLELQTKPFSELSGYVAEQAIQYLRNASPQSIQIDLRRRQDYEDISFSGTKRGLYLENVNSNNKEALMGQIKKYLEENLKNSNADVSIEFSIDFDSSLGVTLILEIYELRGSRPTEDDDEDADPALWNILAQENYHRRNHSAILVADVPYKQQAALVADLIEKIPFIKNTNPLILDLQDVMTIDENDEAEFKKRIGELENALVSGRHVFIIGYDKSPFSEEYFHALRSIYQDMQSSVKYLNLVALTDKKYEAFSRHFPPSAAWHNFGSTVNISGSRAAELAGWREIAITVFDWALAHALKDSKQFTFTSDDARIVFIRGERLRRELGIREWGHNITTVLSQLVGPVLSKTGKKPIVFSITPKLLDYFMDPKIDKNQKRDLVTKIKMEVSSPETQTYTVANRLENIINTHLSGSRMPKIYQKNTYYYSREFKIEQNAKTFLTKKMKRNSKNVFTGSYGFDEEKRVWVVEYYIQKIELVQGSRLAQASVPGSNYSVVVEPGFVKWEDEENNLETGSKTVGPYNVRLVPANLEIDSALSKKTQIGPLTLKMVLKLTERPWSSQDIANALALSISGSSSVFAVSDSEAAAKEALEAAIKKVKEIAVRNVDAPQIIEFLNGPHKPETRTLAGSIKPGSNIVVYAYDMRNFKYDGAAKPFTLSIHRVESSNDPEYQKGDMIFLNKANQEIVFVLKNDGTLRSGDKALFNAFFKALIRKAQVISLLGELDKGRPDILAFNPLSKDQDAVQKIWHYFGFFKQTLSNYDSSLRSNGFTLFANALVTAKARIDGVEMSFLPGQTPDYDRLKAGFADLYAQIEAIRIIFNEVQPEQYSDFEQEGHRLDVAGLALFKNEPEVLDSPLVQSYLASGQIIDSLRASLIPADIINQLTIFVARFADSLGKADSRPTILNSYEVKALDHYSRFLAFEALRRLSANYPEKVEAIKNRRIAFTDKTKTLGSTLEEMLKFNPDLSEEEIFVNKFTTHQLWQFVIVFEKELFNTLPAVAERFGLISGSRLVEGDDPALWNVLAQESYHRKYQSAILVADVPYDQQAAMVDDLIEKMSFIKNTNPLILDLREVMKIDKSSNAEFEKRIEGLEEALVSGRHVFIIGYDKSRFSEEYFHAIRAVFQDQQEMNKPLHLVALTDKKYEAFSLYFPADAAWHNFGSTVNISGSRAAELAGWREIAITVFDWALSRALKDSKQFTFTSDHARIALNRDETLRKQLGIREWGHNLITTTLSHLVGPVLSKKDKKPIVFSITPKLLDYFMDPKIDKNQKRDLVKKIKQVVASPETQTYTVARRLEDIINAHLSGSRAAMEVTEPQGHMSQVTTSQEPPAAGSRMALFKVNEIFDISVIQDGFNGTNFTVHPTGMRGIPLTTSAKRTPAEVGEAILEFVDRDNPRGTIANAVESAKTKLGSRAALEFQDNEPVYFLAKVYQATGGLTGEIVVGSVMFSVEENGENVNFYVFGKLIFTGSANKINLVSTENGSVKTASGLTMGDFKLLLTSTAKAVDEKVNTWLDGQGSSSGLTLKEGLTIVDLDKLAVNDDVTELVGIAIPALVGAAVQQADLTPSAKVLFTSQNAMVMQAVKNLLQTYQNEGKNTRNRIYTNLEDVPAGLRDNKGKISQITTPNHKVSEGLQVLISALGQGDVPNAYAALRVSYLLTQVGELKAADQQTNELLTLILDLLDIENTDANKNELLDVLTGKKADPRFSFRHLTKLDISKLVQGARLVKQFVEQAA